MVHVLAMFLFAALTLSPSMQDEGKSLRQSDKANATRHDAEQKKNLPPAAAPIPRESQADKPTFQYNQTYAGETAKPVHNWVDILNAISTAVVGAFTIVLGIVGILQFRAARTAERAWIVANSPTPTHTPQNHIFELSWPLMNNGRTPGWITELGSAGKIVNPGEELPENPPYTMAQPFPREGTVLTPNGQVDRAITISEAKMAQLVQGHGTLYVFGIVKYRDIFGGRHETRYCYRFKPGPTNADPAPRDFYVDGPPAYLKTT